MSRFSYSNRTLIERSHVENNTPRETERKKGSLRNVSVAASTPFISRTLDLCLRVAKRGIESFGRPSPDLHYRDDLRRKIIPPSPVRCTKVITYLRHGQYPPQTHVNTRAHSCANFNADGFTEGWFE